LIRVVFVDDKRNKIIEVQTAGMALHMKQMHELLENIPKAMIPVIAIFMVMIIGYLDHLTGFELALSIFYLLPILLVAWYGIRTHAVIISVFSAITWLWADMDSGHSVSHPAILTWNTVMLLGFFLVIVLLTSKIKVLLENERSAARVDFVTGALNHRAFHEIAQIEMLRADRHMRPVTMAYIDVDDFKKVNDTLGHGVGDSLLRSVAETIKLHIRSSDIVSRLGGDEFAILMPETDQDNAIMAMSKVHNNLMATIRKNNWPVTFSIGVVSCHRTFDLKELMKAADDLMYSVKSSGKNRVAYSIQETSGPVHRQAVVRASDKTPPGDL
jgi:diguanylate cyclase (GGDEF)-like protein